MNINKKIDELNTEIHDRMVLLLQEEEKIKDLNRRVRVLMTIENISNKMFQNN